ncbi:MAG TPA: hypothetical protein VMY42_25015 [Thermoguttaceae bacterium]|nr:hypothetical protein [Thermoguttaceae bacterium]
MDLTTGLLIAFCFGFALTFTEPADFEVSATEPKTAAELRAFMDDTNTQLWEDINAGAAAWEGRMKFAYPRQGGNVRLIGCHLRFVEYVPPTSAKFEVGAGILLIEGKVIAVTAPIREIYAKGPWTSASRLVAIVPGEGGALELAAIVLEDELAQPYIIIGRWYYNESLSPYPKWWCRDFAGGVFPKQTHACVGPFVNGQSRNGTSAHNGSR